MFLQASVILLTGGVPDPPGTWSRHPPGPGTPQTRYTPRPSAPPEHQVHPPDQVPPKTRYTPWTRYTAQPGTPPNPQLPDQVHPPGPGTPPRTRYTPPRTRYTPRHRACWEIQSTRRQYASYCNAMLLVSVSVSVTVP